MLCVQDSNDNNSCMHQRLNIYLLYSHKCKKYCTRCRATRTVCTTTSCTTPPPRFPLFQFLPNGTAQCSLFCHLTGLGRAAFNCQGIQGFYGIQELSPELFFNPHFLLTHSFCCFLKFELFLQRNLGRTSNFSKTYSLLGSCLCPLLRVLYGLSKCKPTTLIIGFKFNTYIRSIAGQDQRY